MSATVTLLTSYYNTVQHIVRKLKAHRQNLMMMIAFMTVNSGLVPLIKGLCAQMYYLRFEMIGGVRSHLLLFFFGRENMLKKEKKQLVQDLILPLSICMYMCTLYTYTNM